jgi:hypothetical protein
MGKYSYLIEFPIHTATAMLLVNILLQYKKCSEKVLISASFFITKCVESFYFFRQLIVQFYVHI